MSVLPKREPWVCVPDLAGDIEHILPGGCEQAHVLVTEFAPTNGFCNLRSQLCRLPLAFDPTPFAEWTRAVRREDEPRGPCALLIGAWMAAHLCRAAMVSPVMKMVYELSSLASTRSEVRSYKTGFQDR